MALLALQPRLVSEDYIEDVSVARPYNPLSPDPEQFIQWVNEAATTSRDWRAESWRDSEMFDGDQWTDEMRTQAIEAGVEPLTINQIFPTLSLVIGSQALNKLDIIGKGRTHKDSEISQIMTEGIKFVMDQNNGEYKISEEFKSQVIAGFGCLAVTHNSDPRREIITVSQRGWKEVGWDPYASPWFDVSDCRYVYHHKWIDLHILLSMFPGKAKEIQEAFNSSDSSNTGGLPHDDEANIVEWQRRSGAGWFDKNRKRCRPVEMWYTVFSPALFLRYPDGTVDELDENLPAYQQYSMVAQAAEVLKANVRKMRVCVFLGRLVIYEGPTPFYHDEFPFVPFVGYLNRFQHPYGIPRQIRDMQIETNKRRSMALRLLSAKQVLAESDVTDQGNLQKIYEEANKPDGFILVNPGALKNGKIQIIDKAPLAPAQMSMMSQSELEIQRVSGVNADLLGQGTSGSESGKAIEKRTTQGVTITAPLFDNLRRSLKKLGELIESEIRHTWTGEKVLRVTDRRTGAERFVEINKRFVNAQGVYSIKNDITQGRYDIVIAQTPISDTVREKNMELIIEWAKKSPPELIGPLLAAAMELSGLPNKDKILAQIKPLLGISPEIDELDAEELKQKQIEQANAKAEMDRVMQEMQMQLSQAQLQKLVAEIEKVRADTARVVGNTQLDPLRVEQMSTKIAADHKRIENDSARVELEGFKTGADVQQNLERFVTEESDKAIERERMDDIEYAKIQTELAKSPPAEEANKREAQNIGTKQKAKGAM